MKRVRVGIGPGSGIGCCAVARMTESARRLALRLPDNAHRLAGAGLQRPRIPGHIAAKSVGTFVPRLTQKAFEKYGFSTATLITDWAAIVGETLARDTLPERLKWPRGVDARGEVETGAEGRPGATLILTVDPARALDVEYRRAQILDRINGYFGYRAVAEIRLVQGVVGRRQSASASASASAPRGMTVSRKHASASGRGDVGSSATTDLASVVDAGLRDALERLHAGVTGKRTTAA